MLSRMIDRRLRARRERGLSIVELLVGVAVGLFLVAGAVTLFVGNLGNSRQLLLEARINQDMRATADLITRDLRRAGYWGGNSPLAATVASAASSPNPYSTITAGSGIVEYAFSRDGATDNNVLDANENFGFQRAVVGGVGVIQMKLGSGNWQTVTDPQSMDVTALTVTPTETAVSVADACPSVCVGAGCPAIRVRQYAVAITANAIGRAATSRTLQTRARARNDQLTGACPT